MHHQQRKQSENEPEQKKKKNVLENFNRSRKKAYVIFDFLLVPTKHTNLAGRHGALAPVFSVSFEFSCFDKSIHVQWDVHIFLPSRIPFCTLDFPLSINFESETETGERGERKARKDSSKWSLFSDGTHNHCFELYLCQNNFHASISFQCTHSFFI